jgi:hypothetical protein
MCRGSDPVPSRRSPTRRQGRKSRRRRELILQTSPAAAVAGLVRGGGGPPATEGGRGSSHGGRPARGGDGGREWGRRAGGLGSRWSWLRLAVICGLLGEGGGLLCSAAGRPRCGDGCRDLMRRRRRSGAWVPSRWARVGSPEAAALRWSFLDERRWSPSWGLAVHHRWPRSVPIWGERLARAHGVLGGGYSSSTGTWRTPGRRPRTAVGGLIDKEYAVFAFAAA